MKTRTEFSVEMQKELTEKPKIFSLILLVLGAVGCVAYIVLSVVFEEVSFLYCIPGALIFALGLVFTISFRKAVKRQGSVSICTEIELFDDFFLQIAFRNGEKTEESKLYYKDMVQWKETKNYFFLYPNKVTAYPVDKRGLGEEGQAFLRDVLKTCRIKKSKF